MQDKNIINLFSSLVKDKKEKELLKLILTGHIPEEILKIIIKKDRK